MAATVVAVRVVLGTDLGGADLRNATLTGVIAGHTTVWPAGFTGPGG